MDKRKQADIRLARFYFKTLNVKTKIKIIYLIKNFFKSTGGNDMGL